MSVLWDRLFDLFGYVVDFGENFYNYLTMNIGEIIGSADTWVTDFLAWLVDLLGVSNASVIELMFTVGVPIWIMYTLVGFFASFFSS